MDNGVYLCTEPIKDKVVIEFNEDVLNEYRYIGNYIVDDNSSFDISKVSVSIKKKELYKDILMLSDSWRVMPNLYFTLNALIYKSNDFYTKKNQYLFLPKANTKVGIKHKTNFKNSFNFLKKSDIDANMFNIYLNNFYLDLFGEKIIYDDLDVLYTKLIKLNDKTLIDKVNKLKCFFMKDVYNKFCLSDYTSIIDFFSDVIFSINDNKYSYINVENMYNINTMRRFWYSDEYLLINLNNIEVIDYVKKNCNIINKIF